MFLENKPGLKPGAAFPGISRGSGLGPFCKEVRVLFLKVSMAT